MSKKCIINREVFINESKRIYGDKYDYSLVGKVVSKTQNVEVICPLHGIFKTNYNRFICEQHPCPKCIEKVKWDLNKVINKIKEIHGDKYDTSKVVYKNRKTKFTLICPQHGEFQIDLEHILRRQGCPKCRYIKSSKSNTRKLEDVIIEANKVHNNTYDYSLIKDYKSDRVKYPIICPEHGVFYQTMNNHIKGKQGCPICGRNKSDVARRKGFLYFKEKADKIHNSYYTYHEEDFLGLAIKTRITCPIHGDFWQTPSNHLFGQGCKLCGYKKNSDQSRLTKEEFINKARKIHGDKYDYSKVDYVNYQTKVCIICSKHGEFWQQPSNHLQGNGCPKCVPLYSHKEDEIFDFIVNELKIKNCVKRERTILTGKELDIYCPEQKIAIEFNGLFWHNELNKDKKYHLYKTEECQKQGVRLIHIYEDEWIDKKDIVKSMLTNLFNKTENKIYARQCEIKEVSAKDATIFLENNHIQGRCPSKIKIGLYHNNTLVSLMTFGKSRHFVGNGKHEWELLRFCNLINTNVIGGASRLFKYFTETYHPNEIITYADRRWSLGQLYNILGFSLYNISKPNYYYIVGTKRVYRFNFRKSILIKKYNCPKDMSEHDFCLSKKWYRIYDCGNYCFVWRNKFYKNNCAE